MCQIQPVSHLGQDCFAFNVSQPGHVPVQHVWKPLGFVGQLIETLIGEAIYACLVHLFPALKNLLSDLASSLPASVPDLPVSCSATLHNPPPGLKEH